MPSPGLTLGHLFEPSFYFLLLFSTVLGVEQHFCQDLATAKSPVLLLMRHPKVFAPVRKRKVCHGASEEQCRFSNLPSYIISGAKDTSTKSLPPHVCPGCWYQEVCVRRKNYHYSFARVQPTFLVCHSIWGVTAFLAMDSEHTYSAGALPKGLQPRKKTTADLPEYASQGTCLLGLDVPLPTLPACLLASLHRAPAAAAALPDDG